MALKPSEQSLSVRGSVLDRLLDDADTPRAHAMRIGEVRASIRRDLEQLLNTRRRCIGWPEDLEELDSSIFGYGLPDLLAMDMAAEADRFTFMKTVEAIIKTHDRRFREVYTHLLKNSDENDNTLRFRIEAVVQLSAASEQIVFDSVVDPACKSIAIRNA